MVSVVQYTIGLIFRFSLTDPKKNDKKSCGLDRVVMDSKFSESILSFGDTDIFNETMETTSPLAGGARGGLSEPEERIAELEREMRLLSWHKVANNAAMKAAIIRTRKLKHADKEALIKSGERRL